MNDIEVQTRDQFAATYLQHLQALALEISVAMDSIAANALTKLQQSVANQETLCAALAAMAHAASRAILSSQPSLLSPTGTSTSASIGASTVTSTVTSIDLKIRETSAAIHQLNLQYAALLKHSGKSIALLASLCRTHTGQFQEARGPRLKHQTWSCEM